MADAESQKLPAGQIVHCAELVRSVAEDQVPAGQGEFCPVDDPEGQKYPGRQFPEGFVDARVQKRPAGQTRHSEADVNPETLE
jgi:hypothetical protein